MCARASSTGTLDTLCHEFITAHGAVPAPLNYRGYPKSICTSINHVVCHGIPGERKLENGDILNIDVTVILNGWHGNSSRMYVAGYGLHAGAQPDGRDLRGDDARRARGEARRDAGRRRPRDPELCGEPAVQRGARLLRTRHRAALPRAAERAAFRQARRRPGAAARHVLHHRADGECRPAGGEGAGRRLDRGDPRPQPVGAVRAHDRRDRDRLRDLYPVAGRVRTSRPTGRAELLSGGTP